MSDYIDRQAAIDKLKKWSDGHRCIEIPTEYAISQFKAIPSADLEEIMICGYPARHLAFVAGLMSKEGLSPNELASILRDAERITRIIIDEQRGIIQRSINEAIERLDGEQDGNA